MPHSLSNLNIDPSPANLLEIGQLLLDCTTSAGAKQLPQLDHVVACNDARKQVPCITCPPVTRIPPEILACIFECYVDCLAELGRNEFHGHPLLCITQVCKIWRMIAESDPHLWTSIHLSFPESRRNRGGDGQMIRHVFDQYLKRSATLPISFTFTDHRTYDAVTENLVSLLVDKLRTHAPRWKRITLHMCCDYFPLLFTFTPCDLSALEYISISGDASPLDRIFLLDLDSATNLKSFTYSGPGPETGKDIHVRWENLAEVGLEFTPHTGPTLAPQLGNLSQCHNIITCSLGINQTLPVNASCFATLPRLKTLRVRRLSADAYVAGTIAPLILPQLQTLEIDASHLINRNQCWHHGDFPGLLARSRCNLLHLSIQDVNFPNDELFHCLALSPALMTLRFIPCPRSQNIYNVICEMDVSRNPTGGQISTQVHGLSAYAGPLIPQLREITLASSAERHLDEMLNMFRSRTGPRARAAGVAALQRVEVAFFDLWHDMDGFWVRGSRKKRVVRFQRELVRWVTENESEEEQGLEGSVKVDSPYLPEYVNVE